MKTVTVRDFLTDKEIMRASQLWRGRETYEKGRTCAQAIRDEIILPNIDRINKALGQDNDPMYLAYIVEYTLGAALRG